MDLLEYYDSRKNIIDIERNTLFLLAEELKRFKKEKNLKDFNDLIEDFLLKETLNKFEALFIDEAQDLSLLQWEMVRKIWESCRKNLHSW
jgi:ATP-dependent exoDNAse (exonuclease V) beta subunit